MSVVLSLRRTPSRSSSAERHIGGAPRAVDALLQRPGFAMATLCGEHLLKAKERTTAFRVALEILAVAFFGIAKIASAHQGGPQRLARRQIPCRRIVARERVLGNDRAAQPLDRGNDVAASER